MSRQYILEKEKQLYPEVEQGYEASRRSTSWAAIFLSRSKAMPFCMPGQDLAMASQFSGFFMIVLKKGQALHM